MSFFLREIHLELNVDWAISRNTSKSKQNFIVEYQNGRLNGLSEIAFNVRYDESRERILEEFEDFKNDAPKELNSLESIVSFLQGKPYSPSLKFGIESAYVHYLANLSNRSVQNILGERTISSIKTSYSIPIMDSKGIKEFILKNQLQRFSVLKVKINRDTATEMLTEVLAHSEVPIRIDGNECFHNADDVLSFLFSIKDQSQSFQRIEFLEQPLPASMHEEMNKLFPNSPVMLMADESVTSGEITSYYLSKFHGVNIKLMKAGGYHNALKQAKVAKTLGLKTMLGCMIETSLGISSALNIAAQFDFFDLDGFLYLKKDPYNLVNEEQGKIFYSFLF